MRGALSGNGAWSGTAPTPKAVVLSRTITRIAAIAFCESDAPDDLQGTRRSPLRKPGLSESRCSLGNVAEVGRDVAHLVIAAAAEPFDCERGGELMDGLPAS